MRYLATVLFLNGSSTKLFNNMEEAKRWLDENNNNLENETYVDVYDEDWRKIRTVPHTSR